MREGSRIHRHTLPLLFGGYEDTVCVRKREMARMTRRVGKREGRERKEREKERRSEGERG